MKRIEYKRGQKINGLTFIREVEPHTQRNGEKVRKALFRCYCGNEFEARIYQVKSGNTKSCGCYQKQRVKESNTTHGLSQRPLYGIWVGMKARCCDPKYKGFKNYGGRGIKICDEWKDDPKAFIDWAMENGWQKGLQIDRISNDGNYEPSNCRFVTLTENNRNRRNALKAEQVREIRNAKLLMPELKHRELAEAYGVDKATIGYILRNKTWVNV